MIEKVKEGRADLPSEVASTDFRFFEARSIAFFPVVV